MSTAEKIFAQARTLPEPSQKAVLDFVKKLSKTALPARKKTVSHRVQLPLIDTKKPGTLHLTNADIEELLA